MSRHFAFNIWDLDEGLEAVCYGRVQCQSAHIDTKDCQVQLCNSDDIHAFIHCQLLQPGLP